MRRLIIMGLLWAAPAAIYCKRFSVIFATAEFARN